MLNPFSHLTDDKLMELYKNGEDMAFEVIYLRHKDKVYSYLSKRLTDLNIIDDIFQNIFAKFHKSRNLYSNEHSLLKWIYTISRSELLDAIKKYKVTLVELKDEHIVSSPENDSDPIDFDSVKSLSNKEKDALKLRYYSDKDFSEISKALNTSEVNSRKLVSRALKKLKVKLGGKQNDWS